MKHHRWLWIPLLVLCFAEIGQAALRVAILGDRTGTADDSVFEKTLRDIDNLKPDLVITVGDLIEGPQPDAESINREWDHVLERLAILSMPFYFVPGNNDVFNDTSRELYSKRTGVSAYYSFDAGSVHFIVLDVSQIRSYENMGRDQIEWLSGDLEAHAAAPLTCVFLHKPFWLEAEQSGLPDDMHAVFVKGGVDWVFSGHYHNSAFMQKDGIRYQMIGSSGGHIGDNPDRGEFYQFGWFTVLDDAASCTIIRPGATEPGDHLPVSDLLAQNAIDETLAADFRIDAPGGGDRPVPMMVKNPGDTPFRGTFAWNDEGSAWQMSPHSGTFAIEGISSSLSFSARQRGDTVYPLPRLAVNCTLPSGRAYTSFQRPGIRLTAAIPSTGKPVTIDGRLLEKAWRKAVSIDEFGNPDGGISAIEATRVTMVHDEANLYIGMACSESEPQKMQVFGDRRDAPVFEGDCVFLMFWCGEPPETCVQIVLNPDGVILDQKGPLETAKDARPRLDAKWNGDIAVAAASEKGAWNLEIRIPLTELDLAPGRTLRFNLIRFQSRLMDSASWSWPATYSWEEAGILTF